MGDGSGRGLDRGEEAEMEDDEEYEDGKKKGVVISNRRIWIERREWIWGEEKERWREC